MAYTVMAYIVVACIVMLYVGLAHIVMASVVHRQGLPGISIRPMYSWPIQLRFYFIFYLWHVCLCSYGLYSYSVCGTPRRVAVLPRVHGSSIRRRRAPKVVKNRLPVNMLHRHAHKHFILGFGAFVPTRALACVSTRVQTGARTC